MQCIFCLNERRGSEEHVFALAIGGTLTTDRVCEPCNSTLGSRVDAALSDFFSIRMRRAELGLAGNSGTPPAMHEMLLGVANLTDDPTRRVRTTFNEETGKLDVRALYHASDVVLSDGSQSRQIIVDERDISQIPIILQRERKRSGMSRLSEEELATEVAKATQNVTAVENPTFTIQLNVSFAFLRHAMMKIAYELAFLWLGESYLDDPTATELRIAICSDDMASTNGIPGYVGDAGDCDVFKFWSEDKTHHLAYAFTDGNGGITMAVRIFDIQAALVWVTKDAARYLTGQGVDKLRFLSIDPATGDIRNVPVMEEFKRLAEEMPAASRAVPNFAVYKP